MDIEEIKARLTYNEGKFPKEALRAAVAQREAVTPVLLDALRAVAAEPQRALEEDSYSLHTYAMYLLAQFREPAAYPALVELFSAPGELVFDLTGDVVTEDLPAILASVCGNELGPIKGMIEQPSVNPYVRSACLRSLTMLAAHGRVPREDVIAYLRTLFDGGVEAGDDDPELIWTSLVTAAVDLHATELSEAIDKAYAAQLVDEWFMAPKHVQQAFSQDREQALAEYRQRHGLIEDTEAMLSTWHSFNPARDSFRSVPEAPREPVVKGPKIGRNDPCPCGSGKKYKKCCLDADRST
jgi:hypothetical protein